MKQFSIITPWSIQAAKGRKFIAKNQSTCIDMAYEVDFAEANYFLKAIYEYVLTAS